ncbi:hypothetical protein FisN_11Hu329 [Fistulifera solaris]|uniref:Uncharacterized protein n=1 Tax=Fistulifera solaris TaxID=1519565 RepID=A0A1Z5K925_FISSO|nr:hypothetical protein FisN_11Hu329 [Fistulifera solaris]|eukprot:GAX22780.1 hypothetical protein FisN_11Hu329 [Fistulifera solaris]
MQNQDDKRTTCKREQTKMSMIHTSNKRKRKNQVHFDESHNQVHVRHSTPEDLKRAWMQDREYMVIRKRLLQILYKFSKLEGNTALLCPDQDCLLGLESFIRKYVYGTKSRQRAFVREVCLYYRLQAQLGVQKDSEALQKLASVFSKGDRLRAIQEAQTRL